MNRRPLIALALLFLLVRAAPRATPFFTDRLDDVHDAVAARADQLANPSTADERRKLKAVRAALAAMAAETTSLQADVAVVKRTALLLDAAFPGDAVFDGAISTALDGLDADVRDLRADFARFIDVAQTNPNPSSARKLPKAKAALATADKWLVAATAAATRAARASALVSATKALTSGGNRFVKIPGATRFQFAVGLMKADAESVPLRAVVTGAAFVKKGRTLLVAGVSIDDSSVGAHRIVLVAASGVTGNGTYPLAAGDSAAAYETCNDYAGDVCTEYDTEATAPVIGTMTVTQFSPALHFAAGTFEFKARHANAGVTAVVANGEFRIKFRITRKATLN